jgi:type III restriction enzyme
MLDDRIILVVEYKGAYLCDSEDAKRQIGGAWAYVSGGQCLSCMPTDRGFDLMDRTIG